MTIKELLSEIEERIVSEGYSKEQILALFKEKEEDLSHEEVLMLGAALEYAKKYNDPHAENIRGLYLRKVEELKSYYANL